MMKGETLGPCLRHTGIRTWAGGGRMEDGDLSGNLGEVYKYMHIYLWTALRIVVFERGL